MIIFSRDAVTRVRACAPPADIGGAARSSGDIPVSSSESEKPPLVGQVLLHSTDATPLRIIVEHYVIEHLVFVPGLADWARAIRSARWVGSAQSLQTDPVAVPGSGRGLTINHVSLPAAIRPQRKSGAGASATDLAREESRGLRRGG